MKEKDLNRLDGDIDRALQTASDMKLDLVVYILTMAKLELANEIGDRKFTRLFDPKPAVLLQ